MGIGTATSSDKPMAPRPTAQGAASRRGNLRPWRGMILAAGALLVALASLYMQSKPAPESERLRVSGNIEMTDAEVSFKIPGRVVERLASEGEMVEARQVVARLDTGELAKSATVAGPRLLK